VEKWHKEQSARAFKERYFALLMGPTDEIGPNLSNYHLWWKKIRSAFDPNNVSPEGARSSSIRKPSGLGVSPASRTRRPENLHRPVNK